MYFSRQSGHVLWTAGLLSSLPFARTQKTPMENLVLADCGPSGGEMLYYPGDAWTGVGNNTNKPTMHVSLPSSQSTPWGRDNGVTANFPNGDIFTVHINPKITDPEAAGDVWHRYDLDKPLKCYSYHWDKVYQRDDGQWCSSAYVCNHRGKAYIAPFDPSSIPIWKVDPSKVKCDSSVKDESLESARRWDASGADWAFFASSLSWLKDNASLTATGLSYSQYISSKYFDGKPQFRCSDIGSNNPCTDTVQCQDTNIPAGYVLKLTLWRFSWD